MQAILFFTEVLMLLRLLSAESPAPAIDPVCAVTESRVMLDLEHAEITENNLNGFCGPGFLETNACEDKGCGELCPKRIVYSNAGTLYGESINLIITADGDYEPGNYEDNVADRNGINGKFGIVNFRRNTTSNHVTFKITASDGSDVDPMPELFPITINDIDQAGCDCPGDRESRYEVCELYGCDLSGKDCRPTREKLSVNSCLHEVDEFVRDDTLLCVREEDDCTKSFESSTKGYGNNNPIDPEDLTLEQMQLSVGLAFHNTDTFTIGYDISAGGYGPMGRNFLFTGDTNLTACVPLYDQ